MRAEKVIYTLLNAAAGVTALVGTRIYAVTRPEGDALPAIVIDAISDTPQSPIDASAGPEPMLARIQVNCLGATPESVKSLLDQARLACHLKSGTIASITVNMVLQDASGPDSYDALVETYMQPIDFIIRYQR